jgi:hypothetical protein
LVNLKVLMLMKGKAVMFPKPQCPVCGEVFETVASVMRHLDESGCDSGLVPQHPLRPDRENREQIKGYESDDPTASTVEGAG